MKTGIQEHNGVIITTNEHFDYYTGPTDAARQKLMNPARQNCRVQTLKCDSTVTVANNKVTVVVEPTGEVSIIPSESIVR